MIKITPLIQTDLDRFKKDLGYDCNLNNPKTHNEYLMHKKYTDRNPLLQLTADKIKVKEYVDGKIGKNKLFDHRIYEGYSRRLALLKTAVGKVIKTNNASARNIFIFEKPDLDAINEKLKEWLKIPYGEDLGEWCYKGIKPGLIVEKMLYIKTHPIYRFLCWYGKCHYFHIQIYDFINNLPKSVLCTTYDAKWNKQEVRCGPYDNPGMLQPANFDRMIEISGKLAEPFDFVRVDLYNVGGWIYFSELTHYPVSGRNIYVPKEFDNELGQLWRQKLI